MNDRLLTDFREQWHASRLLRLGSWGIGLILLLYLLLWMDDQLTRQQLEWRRAEADVREWQALARQDYWPGLVSALEQQRSGLLQATWPQRTTGLAQAALREYINASTGASQVPLRVRGLELTEPQSVAGGLHEMRGRLTLSSDTSSVPWAWLAELENARPAIYIDSLEIRVGSRSSISLIMEFRLVLSGIQEVQP